jgi:hypothetical protein
MHPFVGRRVRQERPVDRPTDPLQQRKVGLQLAQQFELGVEQPGRPGIDIPVDYEQTDARTR